MTDKKPPILTGRRPPEDPVPHYPPPSSEFGKQLRKVFEAKKGCYFIETDYSAVELRVYKLLSEEERRNIFKPCELYPRRNVSIRGIKGGYIQAVGPVIKSKEEEPK